MRNFARVMAGALQPIQIDVNAVDCFFITEVEGLYHLVAMLGSAEIPLHVGTAVECNNKLNNINQMSDVEITNIR